MPQFENNVWVRMCSGGDLDLREVDAFRAGLLSLRAELLKSYSALIQVGSGGDVAHSDLAGRVKIKLTDGSLSQPVKWRGEVNNYSFQGGWRSKKLVSRFFR